MIYSINGQTHVKPADEFFIDANVLYFLHSDKSVQNQKRLAYLSFIKQLQENGNVLFVSSLNLQEVLHVIEKKRT